MAIDLKKLRTKKPPLLPRQPGQSERPGVSLRHQRLIGQVMTAWAMLEAAMEYAIWIFVGLNMDDGRILTARMDARTKLTILRALGERHLDKDKQDGFISLLNLIQDRQEDRNFIAHAVPLGLSLRPKTQPGEVLGETFPADRMHSIIDQILLCRDTLDKLIDALAASRGIPAPPTPPDS